MTDANDPPVRVVPETSTPLAAAVIRAALTAEVNAQLASIDIHASIDSTNAYLLRQTSPGNSAARVCLADSQSEGHGRRGRFWYSPPAANLYLSLLWHFDLPATRLMGLSVVAGIAVAQALHHLGAAEVGLKWPNDLLWHERKLGGILVELASGSSTDAVIGIGLNVAMPDSTPLDRPWTDLQQITGRTIDRNGLVATVLNSLVPSLREFAQHALDDLPSRWAHFDHFADREVTLQLPTSVVHGIARGIDSSGALRLETHGDLRTFTAGEVTFRLLT